MGWHDVHFECLPHLTCCKSDITHACQQFTSYEAECMCYMQQHAQSWRPTFFPFMQASDEVDMKGPHGFFQPLLGGWHALKGYPTLITTQMSGRRAGDALTYLTVSLLLHLPPTFCPCTATTFHTFLSLFPTCKYRAMACPSQVATSYHTQQTLDTQIGRNWTDALASNSTSLCGVHECMHAGILACQAKSRLLFAGWPVH